MAERCQNFTPADVGKPKIVRHRLDNLVQFSGIGLFGLAAGDHRAHAAQKIGQLVRQRVLQPGDPVRQRLCHLVRFGRPGDQQFAVPG